MATSAENTEKISANEGGMEALIKRRRRLLEELAALGGRLFACSSKPVLGGRSRLRYHLARKRLKRKAGGSSGNDSDSFYMAKTCSA